MKTLSVLIITRNRLQSLKRTIFSLEKQSVLPLEVIIVDSSDQNNENQVAKFRKKLRLKYIFSKKIGFSVQRNIALNLARGDIIVTIDDDSVASFDWCEKILEAHLKDKAAAIVGKVISEPLGSKIAKVVQIQFDDWIRKGLAEDESLKILTTKNASFKKSFLKLHQLSFSKHPYFDSFGAEDRDLGLRIVSSGGVIKYNPEILLYHFERSSLFEYLKQRYRKGQSFELIKYKWDLQKTRVNVSFYDYFFRLLKQGVLDVYLLGMLADFFGRLEMSKILKLSNFPFDRPLLNKSPIIATDLEVAIITRNRAQKLKRLLNSLTYQLIFPSKVMVVDNNSTDETKKIVKEYQKYLPIHYFEQPKIGIPFARNKALEVGVQKYLAFIDDDCTASIYWISSFTKAQTKYPEAAAIQGYSISQPSNNIYSFIAQFYRRGWLLKNLSISEKSFNDAINRRLSKKITIEMIDTRNVSLNRSLLKRLNIKFDESLQKGSDTDLAKNLVSKNQEIIFYPNTTIYHWERENLFSFLKQNFERARGNQIVIKKWQIKSELRPFLSDFRLYIKTYGSSLKYKSIQFFIFTLYVLSAWLGRIYQKFKSLDV